MARPVYLVLSRGGAWDKDSNLYSAFDIIERLRVSPIPQPSPDEKVVSVRWEPYRITACWMIDTASGDRYDDEFEFKAILRAPDGKSSEDLGEGIFRFGEPDPKMFRRIIINTVGHLPLRGSGLHAIVVQLRKVGVSEWGIQEYPLMIEEATP